MFVYPVGQLKLSIVQTNTASFLESAQVLTPFGPRLMLVFHLANKVRTRGATFIYHIMLFLDPD